MPTNSEVSSTRINIIEFFDGLPITGYQIRIFILCLSVTLLDGYDNQVIGVAAPRIAQMLHLTPKALGAVLSASHLGVMIGALVLGTLADRWGRKHMLILSALIFGVFSLLLTQITSVEQLAACRLLAGIGIGGAIPNGLAFGTEYAPRRVRASLATFMWVGVPAGGILAGLAAAYVLPTHSWQTLFWIGGALPILVAVVAALFLPESLAFLVRQGKDKAQIRRVVSRISPDVAEHGEVEFYIAEQKLPGVPVKHLFSEGRAVKTVLIWVLGFLGSMLMIFMATWTPSLLRQRGASVMQASLALSLWNVGSVVATLSIGRIMDRLDYYRLLTVTYALGAIAVATFGMSAGAQFALVAVIIILAGMFVSGSNSGLMALTAITYPVGIRATGIGWAYAFSRLGAMSGPLIAGFLLARGWRISQVIITIASAGILCAIAIAVMKTCGASVDRGAATAEEAAAGR